MPKIFKPHPYQEDVLGLMTTHRQYALLLDPGMGKTPICLEDFRRKKNNLEAERALVVAPLRTCYNVWRQEAKKWVSTQNLDIRVAHNEGKNVTSVNAAEVVVINPDGLKWMIQERKKLLPFHVLYVDESTLFKNSTAKRSRAIYNVSRGIPYRYILTGTPAPKGIEDLFGQFKILDEQILGSSLKQFRGDFCFNARRTQWGVDWQPTKKSHELITKAIKPHAIRLEATDHLDMPDLVRVKRMVSLPSDVRKMYDELHKELYVEVKSGEVLAVNQAVMTGKCRQIANGAVYLTEDGEASAKETRKVEYLHQEKAKSLIDLYNELGEKPLLVAYEFGHDLTTIKQAVKREFGFTPRYIGDTTGEEEDTKLIEQWNNRDLPMLLINPAGASHGLNLQAGGHHVCWYSLTWNLEHYLQLNGRLWRQGQREGVFIHHIIAKNTVDENVWKVTKSKEVGQISLLKDLKKGAK